MKLIQRVYILALVACFAGNGECISSGTAVSDANEFPYQAAVLIPVIMCNGAIVSSRNVLTTATCVRNITPENVQVHVGYNTYYSNGFTFNVANILTHPTFNPSTFDKNIAILTVDTPFDFHISTVKPIPLATVASSTNAYITATAFGAVNTNLDLPDELQKVSLISYPITDCTKKFGTKLTSSMFCAGDPDGRRDFCPGDQGAPAVFKNKLVGIYSWGCSCGLTEPNPSTPVFNSIPYLYSWITSNIIQP